MRDFTHAQTVSTRPLLGRGVGELGTRLSYVATINQALQAQKQVVNVMICIPIRLAGLS